MGEENDHGNDYLLGNTYRKLINLNNLIKFSTYHLPHHMYLFLLF